MKHQTSYPTQLPENLRLKFQALERRLWWVDTTIAVCGALSGLIISYALIFISDRFWDTPPVLRAVCTLAGLGVSAWFAWGWLRHWVWQRRDSRALANVVQRKHRRLGDRLLGIVELADEGKRPANVSAELCRAAIDQVSTEAVSFDFGAAVATRKPKIYFLVAVLLGALILAPWCFLPGASWNAFARWVWPGKSVERYTFVSLDQLPSSMVVAHGEPFEISCTVRLHPFWKNPRATGQYNQQTPVAAPLIGGKALFKIPAQTKAGLLTLKIGDVTKRISVEPTFRPALKQLAARIHFPEYLQHPNADEPVRNGAFSFLEGSQAIFKGQASRALATATVGLAQLEAGPAQPHDLTVRGAEFQTRQLPLDGLTRATFNWRDQLGLAAPAAWSLGLLGKKDGAPEANCPDQAASVAMLAEEVLEIKTAAEDDYGLRELGVTWECQRRQETNIVARADTVLKPGAPQSRTLASGFRFSPTLLHLPEDTVVTLRAYATDYLPSRRRAESALHRIYILSREEHARLVQQQFEKIAAELEEVTRREESLAEAGRETKNLPAEKLAAEAAAKKLGDQAAEQSAIARKTEALAQKAAETMREAMRNKSIPNSMIQQWARHLEAMQSLASEQMPPAAQSLSSAQQNPSQRAEQVDKAVEQEKKIVAALQDLQKKIGSTLDKMQAATLAQRLRKVAGFEKEIGDTLRKMLPETIGLAADKLPPRHQETALRLTAGQEKSGQESQSLQDEISRFFDRTSITNYGHVVLQMKETKVVEEIGKNIALLRKYVAVRAAAQTDEFAKNFNDWAAVIEDAPQDESEPSDSQGESAQMSEAALRRLLALMRLRQAEENVRENTTALEEMKEGLSTYREDSKLLSVFQSFVADDLQRLAAAGPSEFLPKAHEAMTEADKLLNKPRTDKPTYDAETDAINLIDAEIKAMMKSGKGQGKGAGMMAMLSQMMGMGAGSSPGNSMMGGTTDKRNTPTTGVTRGGGDESRATLKTSGRATRAVPAEFREALQNYYKAVDQPKP